jgi:hypothetical protein
MFPTVSPNFSLAFIQTYNADSGAFGEVYLYQYEGYSTHFESITAVSGGFFLAAMFYSRSDSETANNDEIGGWAFVPVLSPGVFGNATWGVINNTISGAAVCTADTTVGWNVIGTCALSAVEGMEGPITSYFVNLTADHPT